MLVYMPMQVMLVSMPDAGSVMAMPTMGATHMLAMALCVRIFLMFIRASLSVFSRRLFSGLRAGCWGSGIRFLGSVRLLSRIWHGLRGGFGAIAGLSLSIGLDGRGYLFFGGKSVAGDIMQRY